ncbi:hypothetical protein TNCV_2733511 [Trichonephila clavipes]|nr:hypothetical protein TNCV_2733511 [Trichonephila clavipes]
MATPGSSVTPLPLGHEDNSGVRYHPRVNTSQWRPFWFNFSYPEVVDAADPSNSRNKNRGNYESCHQTNQCFESMNELNRDDRRFDRGYQSGNRELGSKRDGNVREFVIVNGKWQVAAV